MKPIVLNVEDFELFSEGEKRILKEWERIALGFAKGECDGLLARGVRIDAGICAKNQQSRGAIAAIKFAMQKFITDQKQITKK
jgi:hypothetical protein